MFLKFEEAVRLGTMRSHISWRSGFVYLLNSCCEIISGMLWSTRMSSCCRCLATSCQHPHQLMNVSMIIFVISSIRLSTLSCHSMYSWLPSVC